MPSKTILPKLPTPKWQPLSKTGSKAQPPPAGVKRQGVKPEGD
jgi:hypothetical protein